MAAKKPTYVELGDALQHQVNRELQKRCDYYSIKTVNEDGTKFDFRYQRGVNRMGKYAPDAVATKARYDTPLNMFYRFCAETGEYDSMLLFLFPQKTRESLKCPAMSVTALCNFARYKKHEKGTLLLDGPDDTAEPVYKVNSDKADADEVDTGRPKEQMKSPALQWKAPKNFDIFGTAISMLHKVHNHGGNYIEVCEDCASATKTNRVCSRHEGSRPCWYNQGNPVQTHDFQTNQKSMRNRNYVAHGCSQIDPEDVRDIRDCLLSPGHHHSFASALMCLKMLVMVLIAIKLFLRADETVTMKESDFVQQLFLMKNGVVLALGLGISGKSEKGVVLYYNLWRDFQHTDLCAVIHLLIYVYKAKIKGGFLFPSDKDLNEPTVGKIPDGGDGYIYLSHESYKSFLRAFKKIAQEVLVEYVEDDDGFRLTTHVFRKGAYCFRIWAYEDTAKIDYMQIKFDARHVKDADAMTYILDATQHKQYSRVADNPRLKVSETRSVRISNLTIAKKHVKRSTDAGTSNLSLYDFAEKFVLSLPCPPNSSIRTLVDTACQLKQPGYEDGQRKQLIDSFSAQQKAWWIAVNTEETRKKISEKQMWLATCAAKRSSGDDGSAAPQSKKQKTASGSETHEDLALRNKLKTKKNVEDKIVLLLEIEKKCDGSDSLATGNYTRAAKKWVLTTMRPALRCFRAHCSSCPATFAKTWAGNFKANFGKDCCSGATEACRGVTSA